MPRPPIRRRRRRRGPGGTWLPVLVLLGIAAAAYLAPYLPAHSLIGAPEIRAPGLSAERVAVRGHFRTCGGSRWRDCVVDGDTIRHGDTRVRLADIDAPETRGARCGYEAELGRRATLRLQELMNEGPFELVRSGPRDEDRFGRKLRLIERDGRSLGDVLIAEGLARRWDGARRGWCG